MKLIGKVIVVGELQEGCSEKGNWRRQALVVETFDHFPKKVNVEFGNPDMLEGIKVGDIVECTVSFESKEYNGKWFNHIRGIAVKQLNANK